MKHTTSNIQQKGFTIAETVIAVSILAFGIVGVYSAFSTVVTLTYNISARFTAAYLAQEGLEIVRNIRDNNFIDMQNTQSLVWSDGLTGSPCDPGSGSGSVGCMVDYKSNAVSAYNDAVLMLDSDGFYNTTSGTPTIFKRKITITPVEGTIAIDTGVYDALNVDVLVTWTYNGKSFSFDANEYLYNWY